MAEEFIGIDGCSGGWLCVREQSRHIDVWISPSFDDVLARVGADAQIGIDIPIGLPSMGPRECDKMARKLLGWPRRASVFPAPVRSAIGLDDFQEACEVHRETDGRGLTIQTFALFTKIREIDNSLRSAPDNRKRVHEVHPEVSFSLWNGGAPMLHRKSRVAGRLEREALIESRWQGRIVRCSDQLPRQSFKRDDLLDALAGLWSIQRYALDPTRILGGERDAEGLEMKIIA